MSNLIFDRFKPDLPDAQCLIVQKMLKRYILGIFISRSGGDVLYRFQVSPDIQADLISNFVAALAIFGEEKIGAIKRIIIEGLHVELSIVTKHDLICVTFFSPGVITDHLEKEAEEGLDKFAAMFAQPLKQKRNNTLIYEKFDDVMCHLIQEYLQRMKILPM